MDTMTRRRVMTPAQQTAVAKYVRRHLDIQARTVEDAAAEAGNSRRLWDKVLGEEGNVTEHSLRQIANGLRRPHREILDLAGYDVSLEPADPVGVASGVPDPILDAVLRLTARLEQAGLLPPELPEKPREGPGAVRAHQPPAGPRRNRHKGSQGN